MGVCTLIDELNRLRKSSSDSIDNEKIFDTFKQYMHVKRSVEEDLKDILREVIKSGKKTLVLLCGSAGDGKSHMLSFLKNYDDEKLLDNFRIHNDATESSAPNKTAIETLSEVLREFSDDEVENEGRNLILAINLGVLNNFIESEYGKKYTKLKNYVEKKSILSMNIIDNGFEKESPFQHVSFADYQLYMLSAEGAHSSYIEEILNRIYGRKNDNPFYSAFLNGCSNCPVQKKCPVKYNFDFMGSEAVRKYVADILVMTIIKEKEILTTREMLNFFYDITVPHDFTYSELSRTFLNPGNVLKFFMEGATPNLIFDQLGVSQLMDHVRKSDPLLIRTEESDDFAVEYYVSTDIKDVLSDKVSNNPYGEVLLQSEYVELVNNDKDAKGLMFRTLIRVETIEKNLIEDRVYDDFVRYLYYYNVGNLKKLGSLYESVEKAVLQWCGADSDRHICLDSRNSKISLFEEVDFDADLECVPSKSDQTELKRFMPELKVGFENHRHKRLPSIILDIDFALFRLIERLNNGLIHTNNDMNNHADFISFIRKLLNSGNSDEEVFVVSRHGEKSVLKKTKFGYKFEVTR